MASPLAPCPEWSQSQAPQRHSALPCFDSPTSLVYAPPLLPALGPWNPGTSRVSQDPTQLPAFPRDTGVAPTVAPWPRDPSRAGLPTC